MANNTNIIHEVTSNGDKILLTNEITLEGCLKDVKVNLPVIPGATVDFASALPIGQSLNGVWTIGDWCDKPKTTFSFQWCITVTDITIVEGSYIGVGITTTTQDIIDDDFIINIQKVCPEVGEDPICEIEEIEEIVYLNPIKPKPKNKKVYFEPIVGQPVQATKITTKKAKVKTNCPNDIKLS